jgi:hypothetical protein
MRACVLLSALFCLAAVLGCGSGGPATAPLKGKVTTGGQPVKGGTLTFAIMTEGADAQTQPVIVAIKEDGTYVAAEGAVPGKHRLLYSAPNIAWEAPEWDGKGAAPQPPPNPYAGFVPTIKEVEVKSGPNEIDVELVKK